MIGGVERGSGGAAAEGGEIGATVILGVGEWVWVVWALIGDSGPFLV